MNRRHLFEFADQAWMPDAWRRSVTEYLQFMVEHGPFDITFQTSLDQISA